jgi:hypothetical protein
LRALVVGLTVMLVALLVEGLAGHNLLRWNFYVGAALLVNAYESATVGQALRYPWARLPIEVAAPHPRGV